ncbi:MAG: hypothetical protein EA405_13610 [Rhodospirillales bacterium]|nr:MAG: hypothetical protein EA405_13610 [Rhodospirillales bacterium]
MADKHDVLQVLASYKDEAVSARLVGDRPRDDVWRENWNLYWGVHDWEGKADWQSRLAMPEAANFVDRWSAAMREALISAGRWFVVEDPKDPDRQLVPHIEKLMDYLLGRCGRTPQGHVIAFPAVFEDLMKIGSLMQCAAAVTWDEVGRFVSVEAVDPRLVWLDPTGRGQYRMRRSEIDKHALLSMAAVTLGDDGESLYNVSEIEQLSALVSEQERQAREASAAHSSDTTSTRKPITLDEYLANIVLEDGTVVGENQVVVVANDRFIIRGPEDNPWWHGQDWLVTAPMVTVPFSVYGKSYMEDWSSVAYAFTEMSNLVMDAAVVQAMKSFAVQANALSDTQQLGQSLEPLKMYLLEDGRLPREFIAEIDMGTLGPEVLSVWEALKSEMREGAKLNEIALGQMAPSAGTTATEIQQTQQSSSAVVRSIARTVEERLLEPVLTLMWATALQHLDFESPEVQSHIGPDAAGMLAARREEFLGEGVTFRVRGISAMVDRQAKLRNMLSMLQVVASNEALMQAFMNRFSVEKVLDQLVQQFGVDPTEMEPTALERLMATVTAPANGAGQEAVAGDPPAIPDVDAGGQSLF